MATCKRCGKEDLIWKTSNRTGSFYLVESDGKTWHSKSCGVQKNPNVYRGACSNVPKADLTQCYWVLKGLYEQPWPATCHPELAERMAAALGVKLEEAKPEKSDRTEYDHRARTAEEDDSDPF